MPLPLTVSCFSKIQIGFTFLVPAHPGSPGKRAVKRECVCVCVFLLLQFYTYGQLLELKVLAFLSGTLHILLFISAYCANKWWWWCRYGMLLLMATSTGMDIYCFTYTHTHPFNGPFSRTTRVGRYQKGKTYLDFTGARDSEWQWHQLGHMQVCTSLQTDNHASTPPLSFLQAGGLPAAQPTVSKHWRPLFYIHMNQKTCNYTTLHQFNGFFFQDNLG